MKNSTMNPWLSIWKEPRRTIRAIVDTNPKYGFYLLATITIFSFYLMSVGKLFAGFSLQFALTSLFALILSPFIGAFIFYVVAWILQITGKWLDGHADTSQLRAVIAWSNAPTIIIIFLQFILILFAPSYFFSPTLTGTVFFFIRFLFFIVGVWQIVLFVIGISEVQKFSIGKAIGNYFLYLLVLVLFFIFLGFIIGSIRVFFG